MEVIIVGAGASGLTCAITLARKGNIVTVLEKLSDSAKKILSTGNGRCNYWNTDFDNKNFYSKNDQFINSINTVENRKEVMDYFESLEPSQKNPVFTKIGGKQISQTIVRTYTEESAFGEDSVRTVTTNRKDWIINYAAKETYSFGTDEDCDMTPAFLAEAMQNREVYLATIKQRQEEYNASKGNVAAAPMAAKSDSPFNF